MAGERPHEFELIRRFFAPLASDPGSLGLTDDAAVLSPRSGFDLVLTKDMLAANVHFFADDLPEAIAAKALRVNLSDLAAKGARPTGYLLGLGLPADWAVDWLARFCDGLAADQSAYDVVLYGGDTIHSGDGLQVSITALGEVPAGKAVRRSGAKAGDLLYASGTVGDAAAGLKARLDPGFSIRFGLSDDDQRFVLDRYLLPRPRLELAGPLVAYASAAMDISDGLIADAGHIAEASSVKLVIDLERVPVSAALEKVRQADGDEFLSLLSGGDDYEILACVPVGSADAFETAAQEAGCCVARIGEVIEGDAEVEIRQNDVPVSLPVAAGFQHF